MTIKLLVTAAGSSVAQGIIKSIRRSGLDCVIIATDNQPYAAGLYRGDKAYLVSLGNAPSFISEIISICKREKVDGIFVGTDYELIAFSENIGRIKQETGAIVFVSNLKVIKIANDKWLTHLFLKENNFPVIPSALLSEASNFAKLQGFPLIIKPRTGDSSKDTFIINTTEELNQKLIYFKTTAKNIYLQQKVEPIIQKLVGSEHNEYTSSTIVFDNKAYGIISMNREMRFGGHTTKAIIKDNYEINSFISRIAETLNPFGPCNFQSKVINNVPYVFEINCRFSGTTALCSLVNFNNVEACIRKILLNEQIKPLIPLHGVVLRYFNEVFVPFSEIQEISLNGFLQQSRSEINKFF
ncbi:ATP-grasp domain-containing protein [Candidatus Woesearchaeota archaeon]|nr:ATP-grasp domain-containing protein [Candidatus Woesearchaeota archaeon]